ncbi:spore germination protein GerPE [Ornithinibacillus halophilus]|uniref:Spore germination protein PE n=1 Tax=Ornithinibacillus halophilus TaxID=930117 RepID=A0A1M5I279_9BACI|nr:spore germination protein GerPE [Ornithinibacillus halophilus]SHG22139.1 Protein of unknown function [Ornithinibacillus halophilus]
MKKRLANVDRFRLNSLAFSSIINIGDTAIATPTNRAIAMQKEGALFNSKDDLQFDDYRIFKLQPKWINEPSSVNLQNYHHNRDINVQNVSVIAASQSSIVQIGSIGKIDADARIKHFRWIQEEE